jgi:1-acyl-sn-glycerol-3-phosphate acyltransferase
MITVHNRYGSPVYKMARGIVWLFFHAVFRFRVVGREHIPRTGPLVLASNHIHNLDPLVIGLGTPRFIHFMAKQELFKYRPFAALIRYFGAFPVRRGQSDKGAIRNALTVPAQGGCLVIFPEGHRSKDGKLRPGQPGVALIARKSNCPVVPVAIIGPYRFRGRLTIRFGEPYTPGAEDTNETVLAAIMQRIQNLLDQGHAE